MGHNLTGLIGPKHALAEFAAKRALHEPVELAQNLYLLPLRDEDIDSFMPPLNDGHAPGFLYLSRQLRDEIAAASKGAAFAYVETFYHGGEGTQ